MASRGINVKIATPKVIKGLETSLAKIKKDFAEQSKNQKAHEKATEAWNKKALKYMTDNIKSATNTNASIWRGRSTLNLDFNYADIVEAIGEEPTVDFTRMGDYEFKEAVEEIENAIRLLKLTDEEFVSTSTYKSVAKYI